MVTSGIRGTSYSTNAEAATITTQCTVNLPSSLDSVPPVGTLAMLKTISPLQAAIKVYAARYSEKSRSKAPARPDFKREAEIEAYLDDMTMVEGQHGLNALAWWREYGAARHLYLVSAARRWLSIPATSAPCERLFSAYGKVWTRKRCRLQLGPGTALVAVVIQRVETACAVSSDDESDSSKDESEADEASDADYDASR